MVIAMVFYTLFTVTGELHAGISALFILGVLGVSREN